MRPIRPGPYGFIRRPRAAILRECTPEPIVGPSFNLLTASPTIEEEPPHPDPILTPETTTTVNNGKYC